MVRKLQNLLSVVIAVFSVMAGPVSSLAQEPADNIKNANSNIAGKLGIGARYGYIDEDRDDLRHEGSASIIYGLNEFTALEAEGGVIGSEDMDREVYSGFVDFLLRLPINNLAPYLRAGLGVQNHKFRDLDDWDNSFSQRVGGGFEYFLTRNFAINAEAVYVWGGDGTIDAPYYRGGIKYYF